MGCCHKKRKRNTLLKKSDIDSDEENQKEESNLNIKLTYNDFTILKLLGRGSFGHVVLARLKRNNKLYAMKILEKSSLKLKHQEIHTQSERDLMVKIHCPFIISIKSAFQDEKYLYIVSDFMQGGDLYFHMHNAHEFDFELTQFFAAELVIALEYLHKNNMVYRDLKPENILIDSRGHIKLTDFGLSKMLKSEKDKAFSICGTFSYLAPEIFSNKGYDKSVDWWALGCLMYEMMVGKLPFPIKRGAKVDLSIYKNKLQFPRYIDNDSIDIITKLLTVDPKKRLGSGKDGVVKIKNHPFFDDVDWDDVVNKNFIPPFQPELSDELDLRYFDTQFTSEPIENLESARSREASYEYKNFTYITESVKDELENIKDEEIKIENEGK